ncbi:MAG: hypothetical protein ABSG53_34110 [Thermoguttaceae bacterium]|jgi:hypothetical protein
MKAFVSLLARMPDSLAQPRFVLATAALLTISGATCSTAIAQAIGRLMPAGPPTYGGDAELERIPGYGRVMQFSEMPPGVPLPHFPSVPGFGGFGNCDPLDAIPRMPPRLNSNRNSAPPWTLPGMFPNAVAGFRNQDNREDDQNNRWPGMLHSLSHLHGAANAFHAGPDPEFHASPVPPARDGMPAYEFQGPAARAAAMAGENFGHASVPVSEFEVPAANISRVVGENFGHASIPLSEFRVPGSGFSRAVGEGLSHGGGGFLAGMGKVFAGIGAAIAAMFGSLFGRKKES